MASDAWRGVGRLEAIVIDVNDLDRATAFWSAVTGYAFGPSVEPQFRRAAVPGSAGLSLALQLVPELKGPKNRVHLDIEAPDVEAALAHVEAAGGRLVRRVHNQVGIAFAVCADPDGNEFCLTPP